MHRLTQPERALTAHARERIRDEDARMRAHEATRDVKRPELESRIHYPGTGSSRPPHATHVRRGSTHDTPTPHGATAPLDR